MKHPLVLAISNQKGGVGKTTTAVNLAATLAAAEYKVLLIDMDPQGNAGSALGQNTASNKTAYEMLLQENDPQHCIQKTKLEHLDIVVSNQELIGAEIELVSVIGREQRLKEAIQQLGINYDFVVIDCPPALGLLTVNALVAADAILIPLQCEYFALEGLAQLLKTVELIKKFLNPKLRIEGILLTMFDKRNNLSHHVEEEVRNHFPDQVYTTKIPRSVKLGEAPSHGLPILLYDAASSGTVAYMEATQELLRRNPDYRKNIKLRQNLPTKSKPATISSIL